ncbi:class I SAM-dependent methyltransferase [Leptolyngbya sp. NIES-2104]|uniref:class I SAM-dependent methyltransferase n=1 Tax=Leptolyngbya sp. NIES-2104 TaxID=1552121 RepID=UPI0006EC60AF|nr:class I SAM-dependent methyltransferase [Leptolyngbya sp. NIES-2104]GAP97098.1 methyltransferase [Leptolyngbya sp. NIES-2104]
MQFDTESVFDQDYLYFYAHLTPERNQREAELVKQLLKLEPGSTVLDLACGHGRIANLLAQHGCNVTGLDITPLFLDLARESASELSVHVNYVQGDMRSLPWSNQFDAIFNLFTAYGYFDDAGNHRVLEETYRSLKPGGSLLLDLINRDFMLRQFQPSSVVKRDDNYLIDQTRFDILTGQTHTERTIIRDGQIRRMQYSVRHFTYTEIQSWLMQAGFQQVEGYGSNGDNLTLESRRMIVVAQK